jgi:large conductance mechanosensitive channel
VRGVVFDYASFVNAVITFVLTAAAIYFLVVIPVKIVEERRRRGQEEGPADPTDVQLLTEIRDLLREQAAGRTTRYPGRDDPGGAAGRIPQQDR